MGDFYWFDILIIGFTLLLALKGIVNGLLKELFGLIGIIGGVLLAARYSQSAANFINTNTYAINNADLAKFAGFLSVLIIFWLLCLFAGNILSKLVKLSGLGFLDRIGGFIFGGAKFFCIFAVLIFCVSRIDFLNEKLENLTQQKSFILPYLKQTGAFIMNDSAVQQGIKDLNTNIRFNQFQFEQNQTQGE